MFSVEPNHTNARQNTFDSTESIEFFKPIYDEIDNKMCVICTRCSRELELWNCGEGCKNPRVDRQLVGCLIIIIIIMQRLTRHVSVIRLTNRRRD